MSRRRQKPSPSPAPAICARRSLHPIVAAIVIVVVGLVAYENSFRGLFVLDEETAIVNNPNIRSLATAFTAPAEVGLGGRPVASLSFALNYALAPVEVREIFTPPPPGYPPAAWEALYRNLWGYHATNLAIHLIAAIAVFGIVRRTLLTPRMALIAGGASSVLALIVATAWVSHPLNTSAISYVAQRVESLMGMFYLVSLYCAIRAGESARAAEDNTVAGAAGVRVDGRAKPGLVWSIAAVAACVLGIATKEVTVTLPIVLVIYDAVFAGRSDEPVGATWRRRWPLYAALASTWILSAALVASAPRAASVGAGLGWSPWLYLQTQAGIIVHYLRLAVLPWPLVFDYEWPAARGIGDVLPYALPLAGLFVASAWAVYRRHPLGFVGAAFFVILGPSSSLLPIVTEIAAEHRMYLPLVAIIAAVVVGAWWGIMRLSIRPARDAGATTYAGRGGGGAAPNARRGRVEPSRSPLSLRLAVVGTVVSVVAVAGCVVLTRERNRDYQSDERLWADTVAKRPVNARALSNLAVILGGLGRTSEAEPFLRRALAVRPDYPEAQSALGVILASQGRVDEALPLFERAVALTPGYADAWGNYAEALASKGRLGDAVAACRRAIDAKPDTVAALSLGAWILATAGDDGLRDERTGLGFAERAVALTNRRDPRSLDAMGAALAGLGRFQEAAATAAEAAGAARARGLADLAAAIDARGRAYAAGRPYREGPG